MVAISTTITNKVNAVAVVGRLGLTALLFIVGGMTVLLDLSNLLSTAPVAAQGWWSMGTLSHVGPFPLAFLPGMLTIVGFESAANLTEETKDSARVIPKAMAQAVISLGLLFLIAITALLGDRGALAQSGTLVATVLGPVIGKVMLVLVVVSIFSCGLVITPSGTWMWLRWTTLTRTRS
jgi:amino acid transporter